VLAPVRIVIDWNVIITVRRDFDRAIGLLRKLGTVERTGLYNVLAMRVVDVRALLDEVSELAARVPLFDVVSHVVPMTHKVGFTTAAELERKAREIALAWAPRLAGKTMHVRMRRRGHKGEFHSQDIERSLGDAVFEELERRGEWCRFALFDPDAVIAIESLRDDAGLALWTRAELERYPWLRASIERGPSRYPPAAVPEYAPSRTMLEATAEVTKDDGHPASAVEIVGLLGHVEPLTLDQLLATGATLDEIAHAVSAIEDEQAVGEEHHAPSTAREAEVRAILEDLMFESFEEREAEREIVRT
jgi:tRNA(Ser,Leu) C12 N-acetylase TAN1